MRSRTTALAVSFIQTKNFEVRIPGEGELSTAYMKDEVCFYMEQFKRGMELPIPEYLANVFNYFKMVPNQFTPNTFSVLRALNKFFDDWSIEWNIPNILSLVTFCKVDDYLFYASPRHSKKFAIEGNPTANHGWRSDFVYVKSEVGWNICTIPQLKHNNKVFHRADMTKDIQVLYDNLNSSFFSLNVLDWSISTVQAGKTLEIAGNEDVERTKKAIAAEAAKKKDLAIVVAQDSPTERETLSKRKTVDEEEDSEEDDTIPLSRRRQPKRFKTNTVVVDSISSGSPLRLEGGESFIREGEADAANDPLISTTPSVNRAASGGDQAGTSGGATQRCPSDDPCQVWFNKEKEYCFFKYNRSTRMVPEIDSVSKVPLCLLAPLTSKEDMRYLKRISRDERLKLQAQLSIASSIVTGFIASDANQLASAKERLIQEDRRLNASKLLLESELKKSQEETEEAVKKLKETEAAQKIEVNGWVALNTSNMASIKGLEKELLKTKDVYLSEGLKMKKRIQELESQLAALTVSVPPTEDLKPKIIEEYKESDDFIDEMTGYGLHGFTLLKKFLLKDNHVDQATLDKYDYVECAEIDSTVKK